MVMLESPESMKFIRKDPLNVEDIEGAHPSQNI